MRLAILLFAAVSACMAEVNYSKDIEPILSSRCGGCHLSKVKMGGLNLETYDGLMQGGSTGKVIRPGKSGSSRLYLMITGEIMPSMPMNSTRLSLAQTEAIREWIDAGAKGPEKTEGETADTKSTAKTDPVTNPAIQARSDLKPQIFDLAWSPDGKLLALAGFKTLRLVDPKTKKVVAQLDGGADAVRSVSFSKDGATLVAAGGLPGRSGEARIWDVEGRKLISTIQGHSDCMYAAVFSPDGRMLATSSYDKTIKLWDVATGAEVRTLKDHIDAVYALAFAENGKRLVSGAADRTVKIWDVQTGERLYTLSEPQDGINTIALDPTGKFVAAGGLDKTIRIWELGDKSGTLKNTLIAHEDSILRLSWSPDGTRLLSSSADKTIKVFDASLVELKTYPQKEWVYGLQWSPDGKTFAVGRFDGTWEVL